MALTVTTWNVENFSDSCPNFQQKLAYLTHALKRIDPDVVALQEILSNGALQSLANALDMHAVHGLGDKRGNRVGFLLKQAATGIPITAWRLPDGFAAEDASSEAMEVLPRPALQVTVVHGGSEVTFLNTHLKSKLLTFPGGFHSTENEGVRASGGFFALRRRAAEAMTLREHVTELLANDANVVVLGDFNDVPEAATTQLLYGPTGSQPKGPADAKRASGAFQKKDKQDPRRLFNVTMLVPESLRWSRVHNGLPELLDQILVSEGLMPRLGNHAQPLTVESLLDQSLASEGLITKSGNLRQVPTVEIRNHDLPNLGDSPRVDSIVPDHAPVTATFPGL